MVRADGDSPPGTEPPPLSPAVARRRVGDDLRRLRELAGMTLTEAGAALERSQATMSRIENGTTSVRKVDVERLLEIYRGPGDRSIDGARRDSLLDLVTVGRQKEWFSRFRDVIAGDLTDDGVQRFISYETYAETMVNFEPDVVPGLLQTPRYARAITDACFPDAGQHERERLVELRMERSETLRKQGSPKVELMIGENALRRAFGGPEVLVEQLDVLAEEVRDGTPTFTVRILSSTLAHPAAVGGPFVVMTFADVTDPSVVFREGSAGGSFAFDESAVRTYQTQFDALVELSYNDGEARKRIEEARKQIG